MIEKSDVFSVHAFNALVDSMLSSAFPFVRVEGEISKITFQASGHWYFSIKDTEASLDCVLFKFNALRQTFKPQIGDKVIVEGVPNIYPQSGRYQLKCSSIKRSGQGSLLEIIEENKRKWANTYFMRPKRPLPILIRDVIVITSLTGDVIHDVLRNIGDGVNVKIMPSLMQGDACPDSVSCAIVRANELVKSGRVKADVLIVARGGGSFEDLYPFNDERIVKALSESELICISAIGHDPDTPLCDFAADLRANTPTQAGSFIRERNNEFKRFIEDAKKYIGTTILRRIENAFQKNDSSRELLKTRLEMLCSNKFVTIDNKKLSLKMNILNLLKHKISDATSKINLLKAYSPYDILDRGYSIVKDKDGKVIRSVKDVKMGDSLTIKLNDGTLKAKSEGEEL